MKGKRTIFGTLKGGNTMIRKWQYFSVMIFAASVLICAGISPVWAATLTVTSTADSGPGSLRDTIAAASPGDTIDFSVAGTITLTTGMLTIGKNLTITGPGASSLTISGNNSSTVFSISAGTAVNISGLTVSNGNAGPDDGGGILNSGTLTLTNVTISNNSAKGGGGIVNGGTLTLTNVTISNNSAEDGGGIFNFDTLTLTNVTISGNSATGNGGGIFSNFGASTLTNVTISGNSAAGVGGGILNLVGADISLRNTIVANSPSGGNCSSSITSLGHNLDSANTCGFTGTGDLINTDPHLGPLALNAPGATETMALLAGSPAIDAADPATFPPTDQRGVARPQGAGPDIGAYEYVPTPAPTSVPAMNEWGIIIFMLLAGLGSVFYMRKRKTN